MFLLIIKVIFHKSSYKEITIIIYKKYTEILMHNTVHKNFTSLYILNEFILIHNYSCP